MHHGKVIPAKKHGPPGNRVTVERDRCGTAALQVTTVDQDSRNNFQADGHLLLIFFPVEKHTPKFVLHLRNIPTLM